MELLIVGGGKMGEALLGGLLAAGHTGLGVVEVIEAKREELSAKYPGVTVLDKPQATNGALIAVKPQYVASTASALAEAGCERVLSVAAGITIAAIEAALGAPIPVVRAMPNTPALVGAGAAAISPGTHATDEDLQWAETILGAVGVVVRVPEASLDAVTGLSGSGPAYVFLVAEAMADAGVLAGLPRDIAETLAFQTLLGSAKLLAESDDGPAQLKAAVTSPGGTTAAGLRELERAGVRSAFLEAVMAAAQRGRELGA
ncbi:pyrroline-5-carboxylate reductase [Solirubrobacter soli]|uniref:pyrroline-5-carboxylate reductase n=1 Tax=Solirubrobacter soli TaxID=363832 RepID=UPI00040D6616|nr:pyrroline-5-carboxylate reductase [Solirubrobacter soli]